MNKINNVIICGLGAIGTIYAEKLKLCTNLKILADEKRIERYKKNPVIFNGKKCDFDFILPDEKNFKADLIIISVKNSGLVDAAASIKNFVDENTTILSLLNGISSEEYLASFYGWEKLLFSYFVGHTSTRKGSEITFDGVGQIVFGEKENSEFSQKVLAIKNLFDEAKIDYSIPEDMEYSMWKKFLVNVGTNQASAILGGAYKLFQNSEKAMNLAKNFMKEAQKIAEVSGVKNTEKMLDEALEIINSMLPETKSSMLQDVESARKTEVEIFAGKVVEMGEKFNIPTPYNKIAFEIISALDEKSSLKL